MAITAQARRPMDVLATDDPQFEHKTVIYLACLNHGFVQNINEKVMLSPVDTGGSLS